MLISSILPLKVLVLLLDHFLRVINLKILLLNLELPYTEWYFFKELADRIYIF